MQFAIGKWINSIIIVEVDPDKFDGDEGEQLLARLKTHFMVDVVLTTPHWEAPEGIRSRGLPCPAYLLIDPELVWREFELPIEQEIPF